MLQNHNLKVDEHEAHSNKYYIWTYFKDDFELLDEVITFNHNSLQLGQS